MREHWHFTAAILWAAFGITAFAVLVSTRFYWATRNQGDEIMAQADRQVGLAAGGIEVKLTSEGPGQVKLDKVAISVEEMAKLLDLRQGQCKVSFANGNGDEVAAVETSKWDMTIKPQTMALKFDLRRRPEADTLLVLREIQQALDAEELEAGPVVIRPLQMAQLEEVVDQAAETFNEQAPEGVTATVTLADPEA